MGVCLVAGVLTAGRFRHPPGRADRSGAIAAAVRRGLPLRRPRPRRIDHVRADGDLIITVCDSAHEELGELADLH